MLVTLFKVPGQEVIVYYDMTGDFAEFKLFSNEW